MEQKIVVIGLPKSGTSSLAAMLRMLGYRVSGPDIHYQFQDGQYLEEQFLTYDAFQDYPWCFEWQRYRDNPKVKFIILNRPFHDWWQSFYESYGGKNEKYLSYDYIKIIKDIRNEDLFLNYYNRYYQEAQVFAQQQPKLVLNTAIKALEWKELCAFLDQPIPRNIFGHIARKPHVRQKEFKARQKSTYPIRVAIRDTFIPLIGRNNWHRIVSFLRRNSLIK